MTAPLLHEQHGTSTGYKKQCRDSCCRGWNARRQAELRKTRALGRTSPNDQLPVAPVRTQILQLRDAGYTDPQIARLTGITTSHLSRLRRGLGRYVTRDTSERVHHALHLAARVPARDLLAERFVDPTGARRRIRALMALGWNTQRLALELGARGDGGISPLLYGDRQITPGFDQRIRDLYDRLWNTPGPSDRTRMHARRMGWLPPLAWDDDAIDDPDYDPGEVLARPLRPAERHALLLDDIAALTRRDWTAARIAEHLRVTDRTVHRARTELRDAGRLPERDDIDMAS